MISLQLVKDCLKSHTNPLWVQTRLLLKEQLSTVKYVDENNQTRYTIKPVVGDLTFDKVPVHYDAYGAIQRRLARRSTCQCLSADGSCLTHSTGFLGH